MPEPVETPSDKLLRKLRFWPNGAWIAVFEDLDARCKAGDIPTEWRGAFVVDQASWNKVYQERIAALKIRDAQWNKKWSSSVDQVMDGSVENERLREALEELERFLLSQRLTGRLGAVAKLAKFAELSAKGEHDIAAKLLEGPLDRGQHHGGER